MRMGLEHELTARYAAGSLGGTLGRLQDSLRRLPQVSHFGACGKTGEAAVIRFPEPAGLADLNQILRLMADAWQSRQTASLRFSRLDGLLEALKEIALDRLSGRPARFAEYHRLALAIDRLRGFELGLYG